MSEKQMADLTHYNTYPGISLSGRKAIREKMR
jgi:hypothetical protein